MADGKRPLDDLNDQSMEDSEGGPESNASLSLASTRKKRSVSEALEGIDDNELLNLDAPPYESDLSSTSISFNEDLNDDSHISKETPLNSELAEEGRLERERQLLTKESESIRSMSASIEKITDNFKRTQQNMLQFTETTIRTDRLLDTWIHLLSQAEHTKALLQNEQWQGASTDAMLAHREEEQRRLALEEEERVQAALAQAAAKQAAATQVTHGDDELTSTTTKGRGRGRGTRGRGRGGVSAAANSRNSTTTATTTTTKIPRTQSKLAASTTQSRYQSVTRTRKTSRGNTC
ncbi:DASH complex subunit Duo1-domain-containing protein [Syncephalis plumigaleata]|nr:DASH complex subunit Duo1-domain-containing protein [Syncephalis plumigaleata]